MEIKIENKIPDIKVEVNRSADGSYSIKLFQEKEKVLAEIKRSEGMLNNPGFVSKAPARLIDAEKQKLEQNRALLAKIEKQISDLK